MKIQVFCCMTRCCLVVTNNLPLNVASRPRTLDSSSTPPWEPQISHELLYHLDRLYKEKWSRAAVQ